MKNKPVIFNFKSSSKYRNRRTAIDGISFDSMKEGEFYLYLKAEKKAKQITDFELQPKFTLLEAFNKDGKHYRAITYIADFKVIYPDGRIEIIDTKGFRTKEFLIKQKLFEARFLELRLKII